MAIITESSILVGASCALSASYSQTTGGSIAS